MKKHILFLMHSLRFGGAERQTADLIATLDPVRFLTSICCFIDDRGEEITVSGPSLSDIVRLGKRGKFDVGLFSRLAGVIGEKQPDIVVCVNQYPLPFVHAIRTATGGNYAIVPVMHSTKFPDRYTGFLIRHVFVPLANRSDSVVFVCASQQDHWIEHYRTDPAKAMVIHNGIDTAYFSPRLSLNERAAFRTTLGFDGDSFVICLCAAFRPEKRHRDLVSATRLLRERGVDARIVLVGDGIEKHSIAEHITQTGMGDYVHLAGYQSDVRPYLEVADAVVNCSGTEAFSLAILEAMAMGKAMVCTDVGGTREQIREGVNGFLFGPGDVCTLADRIARLLDSGLREQFGVASREIVESRFSLRSMAMKYQQLLDGLP